MSGIINPKSIVNNAFSEIADDEEEGEYYFFKKLIFYPLVFGILFGIFIDLNDEMISYLGTTIAILAGFSINAIFSLTTPLEADSENDQDLKKFFQSLRYYTSYSVVLVLFILSMMFLLITVGESLILEIIIAGSLFQYIEFLLIIIRRVDTIAKISNS